MKPRTRVVLCPLIAALLAVSCPKPARDILDAPGGRLEASILATQALVMEMSDEYDVALTDSMSLIVTNAAADPTSRRLAQSFLRNGVGASLSIAAGPNPNTALLDLLVLASLQRWDFTAHTIPEGISEPLGRAAAEKLERAEADMWHSAARVLSDEQLQTLRGLIDAWIKANPDRRVVSFVRFDEFTDIRNDNTLGTRTRAEGLFREISEASATVDDARLLGERLMWYAARYPYVVGQHADLLLYRVAEQPEIRSLLEAVESTRALSASIAARVESLDRDMTAQQDRFMSRLAAERSATVEQAKSALAEVSRKSLEDLEARAANAREAAIAQGFDRFAKERKDLLDDLESRQEHLRATVTELRGAIGVSTTLAHELTGTVQAIDRVVDRFDREPGSGRESLNIKNVRDAAVEVTHAAERLTTLLERTNQIADSDVWDQRLNRLDRATSGLIDRAFWRALGVVAVLLAGLAVLRLMPQRGRSPSA